MEDLHRDSCSRFVDQSQHQANPTTIMTCPMSQQRSCLKRPLSQVISNLSEVTVIRDQQLQAQSNFTVVLLPHVSSERTAGNFIIAMVNYCHHIGNARVQQLQWQTSSHCHAGMSGNLLNRCWQA